MTWNGESAMEIGHADDGDWAAAQIEEQEREQRIEDRADDLIWNHLSDVEEWYIGVEPDVSRMLRNLDRAMIELRRFNDRKTVGLTAIVQAVVNLRRKVRDDALALAEYEIR